MARTGQATTNLPAGPTYRSPAVTEVNEKNHRHHPAPSAAYSLDRTSFVYTSSWLPSGIRGKKWPGSSSAQRPDWLGAGSPSHPAVSLTFNQAQRTLYANIIKVDLLTHKYYCVITTLLNVKTLCICGKVGAAPPFPTLRPLNMGRKVSTLSWAKVKPRPAVKKPLGRS